MGDRRFYVDRIDLLPDGRVGLTLARPWADGTCALAFTGVELREKLAVLIPSEAATPIPGFNDVR